MIIQAERRMGCFRSDMPRARLGGPSLSRIAGKSASFVNRMASGGLSAEARDRIMVLSATDLPEPVVPAMRRWGILARGCSLVL
jgi:hypothetical protein